MPTLNNDMFLVIRRDGSIAADVFVLDPESNPAASSALQAMASAAETFGLMTAAEAERFREIAAEWGNRPPLGTPEPVRKDNRDIVRAITNPPADGRVTAVVTGKARR